MGEDEPDWLFQTEQSLLVLHNQVIGALVVAVVAATLRLRIHHVAFLVHREITLVDILCRIPWVLQIAQVGGIGKVRNVFP